MIIYDLVTGLPQDILHRLLADWIDIANLVSLDSAYCSTFKRPSFLLALSALQVHRLTMLLWEKTQSILHWVINRNVRLTDINIHSSLDEMLLESLQYSRR